MITSPAKGAQGPTPWFNPQPWVPALHWGAWGMTTQLDPPVARSLPPTQRTEGPTPWVNPSVTGGPHPTEGREGPVFWLNIAVCQIPDPTGEVKGLATALTQGLPGLLPLPGWPGAPLRLVWRSPGCRPLAWPGSCQSPTLYWGSQGLAPNLAQQLWVPCPLPRQSFSPAPNSDR